MREGKRFLDDLEMRRELVYIEVLVSLRKTVGKRHLLGYRHICAFPRTVMNRNVSDLFLIHEPTVLISALGSV